MKYQNTYHEFYYEDYDYSTESKKYSAKVSYHQNFEIREVTVLLFV